MARRKKVVEQPVVSNEIIEEVITTTKNGKIITNKMLPLFYVVTLSDVNLYKTSVKNNPQGKLKKGQIINVVKEINYTPVKMYKLDTGYYIVADQNIRKY